MLPDGRLRSGRQWLRGQPQPCGDAAALEVLGRLDQGDHRLGRSEQGKHGGEEDAAKGQATSGSGGVEDGPDAALELVRAGQGDARVDRGQAHLQATGDMEDMLGVVGRPAAGGEHQVVAGPLGLSLHRPLRQPDQRIEPVHRVGYVPDELGQAAEASGVAQRMGVSEVMVRPSHRATEGCCSQTNPHTSPSRTPNERHEPMHLLPRGRA